MRHFIFILLLAFSAISAFGQRVTDNLHLLTASEVSQLESNIGSRPIYIETLDSVSGDLKAYADSKVQTLAGDRKAVLIVITTHPHAWRISEWPHGLVSVQSIGDSMASQLRGGHFFAAFNGAARDIDYAVTHRPNAPPVKTVVTTTTHTQTHTQSRPIVSYRTYDPLAVLLWTLFIIAMVSFIIWVIVDSRTPNTVVIHDRADDYPSGPSGPSSSTARQYANQYSPAQRQAIVNNYAGQPGYYPGIYRDPMSFYMFLMTMNALTSHPYYGYGYGMGPQGAMGSPVIDQTTDTTTTTTTETTRSDDGGAGGGWGSSPSSPSNDDSGSSGSWGSSSDSGSSSSSSSDSGSSGGWDSGGSSGGDSGGSSGGGDSGGGSW